MFILSKSVQAFWRYHQGFAVVQQAKLLQKFIGQLSIAMTHDPEAANLRSRLTENKIMGGTGYGNGVVLHRSIVSIARKVNSLH